MNLDELERRFIRAAQHELAPSAADRERNQAALLERLAAQPSGGAPGAAVDAPSHFVRSIGSGALAGAVGAVRSSRVGMLGVGLVVGAMVGGWFGFGLGRGVWMAPPARVSDAVALPRAAPSELPEAGSAAEPELPAAPPPAARAPEPAASLETSPAGAAAEGEAARRRALASGRAHAARRASLPAEPESSLALELAMLQRARRALNAENGRLALGIVEELDERFPKGVLVEERGATRILSLCQLDRKADARRAARDFLERYPSSVYAERVRQSCASASPH